MKKAGKILAAASALAAMSYAAPASAATIILNDIGGVTGSPAEEGFKIAAKYWQSVLTDPVTINLNVGFASLGPGIIGSTGSSYYITSFSSIYGALGMDVTSTLDATAVSNLVPLSGGALSMVTPGYVDPIDGLGIDTTYLVYDNDGSYNNLVMGGTSAAFKAMGYGVAPAYDAQISFSSDFAFDFDPTDGIGAGQIDFIGVAVHEIGHSLGFTSGVDYYDIIGCPNGPYCAAYSGYDTNEDWVGEMTDLFRYGAPDVLVWAPGVDTYFSIDGGNTEFLGNAGLSSGSYNGDGWQASHWQEPSGGGCTNFVGVMNPYACYATVDEVTAQDLGMFDAIGWDIAFDVLSNPLYKYTTADMFLEFGTPAEAIPEPATWLQMLLGFGLLGGLFRVNRRRRTAMALA